MCWKRWGLEVEPERAGTETPMQFTDGHDILRASDGSAMVHLR